ncbi:MAG: wapA 2, partial [Verrucomicrobiales bacterium]|nr:wapA 2 [Verrucomicrobiales bacterium]
VLFRTRGNWIEMPVRMAIPRNLGTPGMPNSRLSPNAGPAIYDVTHLPVLPRANEPVVVSCRVSDPDGIAAATLRYRTDPATTITSIAMRDDGSGGDAIAGDGIYSATIPAKSGGTVIAFTISAADAASAPATAVFPAGGMLQVALPFPECYVRWDDPFPAGNIAHYHLWDSQASEGQRNNALNNTYRDTTMVYGNFRVIYNAGYRDKGSPFHGGAGSFSVINPDDEPLLGVTERIFRTTGNGGPDDTGIRNRLCAWIGKSLGIPYLHSHFMQLYRNGAQHENVSQDEEFPSGYTAKSWFPDGGAGDLYKVAVWFEFQDDNLAFGNVSASLDSVKSAGNYKMARYRWNWQTRGFGGTENNYTNVFNLVAVANDTSTNFVPNVLNLVDAEEWMRVFAFDRLLGNWDSWTYNVGQNMYAIKQPGFSWELMPWDIDFTLGAPGADGATIGLFGGATDGVSSGGSQDGVMSRWFNTPAFRRMQWRAYLDIVNNVLVPENYRPVGDALSSALTKNGIGGINAPAQIYSFMTQRRNYIQARLTQNNTPQFTISNNAGNNYVSTTGTTVLTGKAPFVVAKIAINGVPYPAVWTDDRTFAINVPLTSATNQFVLTALDRFGQTIVGLTDSITVTYKGAIPQPQDSIVINEIYYNPLESKASFVELYNSSTTTPFDLSGYRFEGLSYDFPVGAVIQPNAYLLLVKDRVGFANAFGATISVFDQFTGSLDGGGENLKLVKPLGLGGTNDLIISDVRYGDTLPWPADADGFGSSLQLIDPSKGSYRVGNWGTIATNSANRVTPGRANANKSVLPAFPSVWLNEVLPNNLTGPADNNGQHDPMIELYNSSATSISLDGFYLTDNYTNLTQWAFPSGTAIAPNQFLVVWADGQTEQSTPSALHTSFRLNASNGSVALVRNQSTPVVMDFLDYKQFPPDRSFGSYPDGEPRGRRSFFFVTPGASNNPAFPGVNLTINEYMADNLATILDPATGQFDDWFELYNAGTNAVDLTSYRLTHLLTNSSEFSIPPGYVLAPGAFLLVWADKATAANQSNSDLHVNFKLTKAGGEIGLFDPNGSLVDSIVFGGQTTDISEGRFPDGAEGPVVAFNVATPGSGNVLQGANQPPVLTVPADQVVAEGMLLSQTITATDPDVGQTLEFSLGLDAPAGAAIDPISGHFTWTPTEEQGPGNYSIAVRVTDNGTPARSATKRFNVSVTEVNRSPSLAPIDDFGIDEGILFSFTATAIDPDVPGNQLSFTLLPGAPDGAAIDSATGLFSWTPLESQGPGVYPITIQVSDNGVPVASDIKSFQITVREVNNPPVLAVIEPQSVDEGQLLNFTATAVDPDSPPRSITYTLEGGALPSGLSIDPVSGVVAWTPTEEQGPGNYFIVIRATENDSQHLSAVQSVGITVREVNRPPVLKALPDLVVEEGSIISFKAIGTDADLPAQTLTYSLLAGSPTGAVIDQNTGL